MLTETIHGLNKTIPTVAFLFINLKFEVSELAKNDILLMNTLFKFCK